MFRKSSLLCLTSNENYSFNLDLVACSANQREEDLFTGNQVSDMAAMSDEFTEMQVKSFNKVDPQSLGASGGTGAIPRAI